MAAFMRYICHSLRNSTIRAGDLARTIFRKKKTHLLPRTPEGFNYEDFKVFYYFPGIRIAYVICSARYLKTAICGALSSTSYIAYKKELITEDICTVIVCTGVYCTLAMYGAAFLCNNLIGKMYINKTKTEVVLSYITSKGQRVNKTFKCNKLVLSDHPNFIAKKYVKQIICPEKNLRYNIYDKKGVKMDFMTFVRIFPNYE